MARGKNRPCTRCGELHGAQTDVCPKCRYAEENAALPVIPCALCGNPVPRDRRGCSQYCSYACASAITEARAKVGAAVAKAVRRRRLPRPSALACVDCGAPARDYDHRRYFEPLAVEPTCRLCNRKRGAALDVAPFVLAHFNTPLSIAEFMARRRAESERRAFREIA